jgi:hypothetical protein
MGIDTVLDGFIQQARADKELVAKYGLDSGEQI